MIPFSGTSQERRGTVAVQLEPVLPRGIRRKRARSQQAVSNSKQQFATSPDLNTELVNAIISAHTTMSAQALDSPDVQRGLKDILLRTTPSCTSASGSPPNPRQGWGSDAAAPWMGQVGVPFDVG